MNTYQGFIDRAKEGRRVRNRVSWVIAFVCALLLFASVRVNAVELMQEPVRVSLIGIPLTLEPVAIDVDVTLEDDPWTAAAALITAITAVGAGVLTWAHRRRNY